MTLVLQAVRVRSGGGDEEGYLVFVDERLVAVLVHLCDELYKELTGRWYLEAGFGPADGPEHPVFINLDEAQEWIKRRIQGQAVSSTARLH